PASSRAGSLSIPITLSPRSANDRASGRPTRPRPTTDTSALLRGVLIGAMRLAARAAPVAHVLMREARDEAGILPRVAPPQAARLVRESVGPLEPCSLHPGRGL